MKSETEGRAAILAAAETWLGTPFHDDARVKGVGVDCAQFVAACFLEAGVVPEFEIPRYQAQWFLHHAEERLQQFVMKFGQEISESFVKPGDLVLYKLGRAYAHAAIVISWPNQIIHAHLLSRMVIKAAPFDTDLRDREVKFFSLWK